MMDSVARKSYVYPAPVGEFHYLGAHVARVLDRTVWLLEFV